LTQVTGTYFSPEQSVNNAKGGWLDAGNAENSKTIRPFSSLFLGNHQDLCQRRMAIDCYNPALQKTRKAMCKNTS
jgi:hypothetical protein